MASQRNAGEVKPATSSAILLEKVNQLVNGLNEKRKRDMELLETLRSTLTTHMENICRRVEHHMYNMYEKQEKTFNEKIQELSACVEKVATLEMELAQFKQDLTSLCQEID